MLYSLLSLFTFANGGGPCSPISGMAFNSPHEYDIITQSGLTFNFTPATGVDCGCRNIEYTWTKTDGSSSSDNYF